MTSDDNESNDIECNGNQMEEDFCCIITKQKFQEPVIAEDGFTYEKSAILDWFKGHDTSPVTRKQIGKNLIDNQWLRKKLGLSLSIMDKSINTNNHNKTDYHETSNSNRLPASSTRNITTHINVTHSINNSNDNNRPRNRIRNTSKRRNTSRTRNTRSRTRNTSRRR